jgi:hypothetical protein
MLTVNVGVENGPVIAVEPWKILVTRRRLASANATSTTIPMPNLQQLLHVH